MWFDRGGLPADQLKSLRAALGGGRPRVLAWGQGDDAVVVGLADRLAVRRGDAWALVPWVDVVSGGWDPDGGRLRWLTASGADEVSLTQAGRLPELFRERVQASIVVSQPVDVPGTSGVTVVARRDPADTSAGLRWHALPNPGVDLTDPGVRAAVDEAVARVRSEWDIA